MDFCELLGQPGLYRNSRLAGATQRDLVCLERIREGGGGGKRK